MKPEYILESSWEVCNKVGGIYTVLSTKAHSLQELYPDKVIFIGPELGDANALSGFIEDKTVLADWKAYATTNDNLNLRIGRWNVPGNPITVLVDYRPFIRLCNELFYSMWEDFGVNSMNEYGDYKESCAFAYSVGKTIESFYLFHHLQDRPVITLFNEWMLGMAALYVRKHIPQAGVIFTTHATSIGRSIAGNDKPLYSCMDGYDGDAMAKELNMEAKHSLEKQTAIHADCFTTVSDITAEECHQLLDKTPDIVTPNGFERNFVPVGEEYDRRRADARATLINVAEKLLGLTLHPNTILLSTSGRYEYRNKGIDVFIESMDILRQSDSLNRDVVAFIMVPAWMKEARADLRYAIERDIRNQSKMQAPFITHWLNRMEDDRILNFIMQKGFTNTSDSKLKIIFVPCYLTGEDGVFQKTYYDLLIGMDATVYPSYYEPWGYTPLESIAFGIPTITTSLSGFGRWVMKEGLGNDILQGVRVIERTDANYFDVANEIADAVLKLCAEKKDGLAETRCKCYGLASKAEWHNFIRHYQEAFDFALKNKKGLQG
jgi:glycosyltransferase involved in cell wall biosynthesis